MDKVIPSKRIITEIDVDIEKREFLWTPEFVTEYL